MISADVSSLEQTAGVIELLRQASAALDAIWQRALDGHGDSDALLVGEASQGVHRALIALAAIRGQ